MSESAPDRERLLHAAVAYAAERGLADLTVRELAAELNTTPRALAAHFGSKDGLLAAVVRAVAERQLAALSEVDPSADPVAQHRVLWRWLADPGLWPHERLFFEAYARALRGRAPLDGLADGWLAPLAGMAVRWGAPPRLAAAYARLALAVHHGLVMDLLATGDKAGVEEAMGLFLRTVTGRLPRAE